MRKETVDIDIPVTSRNGDKKIIQSIRITSRPPSRIVEPVQPVQINFYQSNTYRKDSGQLFQVVTRSTCPDTTSVFHTWLYGQLVEIQSNLRRKKLHRMNQGSNFLGGSFSNRVNVRSLIQFRRESQPQHLKKRFFLKNTPIHFHMNSTSVIKPVK